MNIHLVDGTYELFRSFYGPPPKKAPDGREVGAISGQLRSMILLISTSGATHIGCAFDTVIIIEEYSVACHVGSMLEQTLDLKGQNSVIPRQPAAGIGILRVLQIYFVLPKRYVSRI